MLKDKNILNVSCSVPIEMNTVFSVKVSLYYLSRMRKDKGEQNTLPAVQFLLLHRQQGRCWGICVRDSYHMGMLPRPRALAKARTTKSNG